MDRILIIGAKAADGLFAGWLLLWALIIGQVVFAGTCADDDPPPRRFAERGREPSPAPAGVSRRPLSGLANPARPLGDDMRIARPKAPAREGGGYPEPDAELDALATLAEGCFLGRNRYPPDGRDCIALIDGAENSRHRAFVRDWLRVVAANTTSPVREKAAALASELD